MANFSKSNVPQFLVDVYQNEYLPEGGREVNAIVTVSATGGGTVGSAVGAPHLYAAGRGPHAAVAIMVDCSGSMDYPPTKMRNAREATAAAIDTLRDGVHFAVIGGTHIAKEVYPGNGAPRGGRRGDPRPGQGGTAQAERGRRYGDRHLAASRRPAAVLGRRVDPGTASCSPTAATEHESPQDLKAALDSCAGRFTCDARGVGTDWRSRRSPGSPRPCWAPPHRRGHRSPSADFTQMMETAMGEVADVALRLWTPVGTEIKFVKQVAPTVEELTAVGPPGGPARQRLPHRVLGRRGLPRLPRVCRGPLRPEWARRCWRPGSRSSCQQGDGGVRNLGAQGLIKAVWTQAGHGGLDEDQRPGRALHRSGGTGASHPTGSGSAQIGR